MFISITCDLYAVHINFQSLNKISSICVNTQKQLIFYFLNRYPLGKIKVEDHNNTSNTKQRRWLVKQDNAINLKFC